MIKTVEYTFSFISQRTLNKDVIEVLNAIPDAIAVNTYIPIDLSKYAVCVLNTVHVHVNETWTFV